MDCTETQQEILVNAYLLAREGNGQVIEDWAYPDAHELAEAGWLERRFRMTANGVVVDVGRPRRRSTSTR